MGFPAPNLKFWKERETKPLTLTIMSYCGVQFLGFIAAKTTENDQKKLVDKLINSSKRK